MTELPKKPADHLLEQYAALKPLTGLLELFSKDIKNALNGLEEQAINLKRTQAAVEDFKVRFTSLGWTLFDNIASNKILEATAADNDATAEEILSDYFLKQSELEHFGYKFNSEKYGPWKQLYDTMVERILAEDYISGVPLIFIIIDGICLKFFQRHPFSDASGNEVFDTLTSGPDTLEKAYALLGSTRRKTNEGEISVPYRHGIIHGLDTNYGHKVVAAKGINILRATMDYVTASHTENIRVEKAIEEQTPPKWGDVIQSLKRNDSFKKSINAWKARPSIEGETLATFVTSNKLDPNSPEFTAADYLNAIVAKNYGALAQASIFWTEGTIGKRAGIMREDFKEIDINNWVITGYEDTASAATNVNATISGFKMGQAFTGEVIVRCIYQSSTDKSPLTRGMEGGSWYVMPNVASAIWQIQ